MRLLLDTHAVLWFVNGDKKLPTTSRQLIESELNPCWVSVGSLWEIVIKQSIGN